MRYPCVIQHSEEDCGAASLATIVKYHGRNFAINRIREAIGTGQQGTNLLGLKRGAEALGFNTRIGRVNAELVDRINEAPLPAIIHWKGYHWVVLYGQKGRKYVIADPAVGLRYIKRPELDEAWKNGVILILNPDETRFKEQLNERVKGFGHFLRLAFNYKSILIQASALNLLVGLLSLATPFLLQILTDELLLQQDWQLLNRIALAVVAMNFASSILEWAQSNLIAHFGERIELGLILQFTRQILSLPLNYYETRRSGEVLIRLQDIQEINQLIFQAVISLPSQLFVALISLVFMVVYSSKLTLIVLGISLLMALPATISFTSLRQKMRRILTAEGENLGILIELFKGAISLKTSNVAPQAWSELQGRFGNLARVTFRTLQIVLFNQVFSKLVSGIGTIAILWFGSSLVFRQQLTIGQLLAFNTMNTNYLRFIEALVGFVDKFTLTQAAGERLSETLEATPENLHDSRKPWAKISSCADITCNQLNFHYPGRIELIKDFSLTIPGGKVTALIGKSGCGKSTIAKLIASAYLPQSGTIVFGSYNQRDLPLDCLRQQIILVPQESHFWTRSILDNFRWSYPLISFEQIVRSCEIAGIAQFINSLPDGYQTILGEFGTNLSGGQKQRLAIARALINEPSILILDESTGALDPISEKQVLQQLLSHRAGKTTIIISHRPQVITKADWIILLDDGQLKLQGSLSEFRSFPGEHLSFLSN